MVEIADAGLLVHEDAPLAFAAEVRRMTAALVEGDSPAPLGDAVASKHNATL